jgi:hypothetical protein
MGLIDKEYLPKKYTVELLMTSNKCLRMSILLKQSLIPPRLSYE